MENNKFMAWDSLKNKLLSWDDIGWMEINEGLSVHSLLSGEYAHFKPLQHTGLTDKEGAEIYEGHIIQTISNGEKSVWLVEEIGVLERDNRHHAICVSPGGNGVNFFLDKSIWSGKIIGHVCENPELLELE